MLKHKGFTRQKFLKAVGAEYTDRYLESLGLPALGPDPAEDAVDTYLDRLPAERRQQILEDWHTSNDVADHGVDYLEMSCRRHSITVDETFPRERLAMHLFLEHPDAFEMAVDLYSWSAAVPLMSHYRLPDDVNTAGHTLDAEGFRADVAEHFRERLRSENCIVRPYDEAGVRIILIAHGDLPQTQLVWVGDQPRPEFFRPAREDVLQYNPVSRVLSMRIDGHSTTEDQQAYVSAFCKHFVGIAAPALHELDSTMSLEPIRLGRFNYSGNASIEWVRLVEADLRFPDGGTATLVRSTDVVQALMSNLRGTELADGDLNSAKLHFKMRGKSGRPRAVLLKPPNRSEVPRDGTAIEAYLREQGVLLA